MTLKCYQRRSADMKHFFMQENIIYHAFRHNNVKRYAWQLIRVVRAARTLPIPSSYATVSVPLIQVQGLLGKRPVILWSLSLGMEVLLLTLLKRKACLYSWDCFVSPNYFCASYARFFFKCKHNIGTQNVQEHIKKGYMRNWIWTVGIKDKGVSISMQYITSAPK